MLQLVKKQPSLLLEGYLAVFVISVMLIFLSVETWLLHNLCFSLDLSQLQILSDVGVL